MSKPIFCSLVVSACLFFSASAQAGIYEDKLKQCTVRSIGPNDKKAIMLFVFSALASNPEFRPYANISTDQRVKFTKDAGAIIERLLTSDCREESLAAFKNEGVQSVANNISYLNRISSSYMFEGKEVDESMAQLVDAIDKSKFDKMLEEAGLADQ